MTTKKVGKISYPAAALIALTAILAGFLAAWLWLESSPAGHYTIAGALAYEDIGAQQTGSDIGKIDVNTASAAELQDLPGIGPVLAGRVIAYREEHGAFETADDLLKVSGIGPQTLESIRPYISLP